MRRAPGGRHLLRVVAFLLGAVFIALGLAALVLPGPLTIPPILLGVWIWASEFDWADRLFQRAKRSAEEAWEAARRRPVISTLTTVSGLVLVGVAVWAVGRYELVDRARQAVGL